MMMLSRGTTGELIGPVKKEVPLVLLFTQYSFAFRRLKILKK